MSVVPNGEHQNHSHLNSAAILSRRLFEDDVVPSLSSKSQPASIHAQVGINLLTFMHVSDEHKSIILINATFMTCTCQKRTNMSYKSQPSGIFEA